MPFEGDCFDINALGFAENFLREQKRNSLNLSSAQGSENQTANSEIT